MTDTKVMVSGGFDPFHVGHLHYIKGAARIGQVIVALNSDSWLIRKKGYRFMSWDDRAQILNALEDVWRVIPVDDSDGTVCQVIEMWRPDYFVNGGDRNNNSVTPEAALCEKLGVRLVYGVGGYDKRAASSNLVERACKIIHQGASMDASDPSAGTSHCGA